jgi:hypothetical protein
MTQAVNANVREPSPCPLFVRADSVLGAPGRLTYVCIPGIRSAKYEVKRLVLSAICWHDACRMAPKVKEKDPHAVALGRKGGLARKKSLTQEERAEIVRKAVQARWEKAKRETAHK